MRERSSVNQGRGIGSRGSETRPSYQRTTDVQNPCGMSLCREPPGGRLGFMPGWRTPACDGLFGTTGAGAADGSGAISPDDPRRVAVKPSITPNKAVSEPNIIAIEPTPSRLPVPAVKRRAPVAMTPGTL